MKAETKQPPFLGGIIIHILLYENCGISIKISVKFIANGPVAFKPALIYWMAHGHIQSVKNIRSM